MITSLPTFKQGSRMKRAILFLFSLFFAMPAIAAEEVFPWSFRAEITNRGTKYEKYVGELLYRDTMVPLKVRRLVTPIGSYQAEEARGWIKVPGLPTSPAASVFFHEDKLDGNHWYRGGKWMDTPREWVYAPKYGYWVDPEYFEDFADTVLAELPTPERTSFIELGKAPEGEARPTPSMSVFEYRAYTAQDDGKIVRGTLLYNGKELQSLGTIRTPIGTYRHLVAGEPKGWFPIDDVWTKETPIPISQAELSSGNYRGPRRAGTPGDWCYSPMTDAWFSPDRLN